jgi:hypothetical protein
MLTLCIVKILLYGIAFLHVLPNLSPVRRPQPNKLTTHACVVIVIVLLPLAGELSQISLIVQS